MLRRVLVFCALAGIAACQSRSTNPGDSSQYWGGPDAAAVDERLIAADNTFGFKLFRRLVDSAPDENIFISPTSIAMALTMTYNGASGETKEAMARTLEIGGLTLEEVNDASRAFRLVLEDPEPGIQLNIANSLWARAGVPFEEDFMDRNRQYFDAEVTTLDFALPDAAQTINNWVDDKTEGRITEIVPDPLPEAAIMYLINAIYFKGTWTYQFDPDQTNDASFRRADGSTVTVPMMYMGDTLRYLDGDGFKAICLPYGGSERMGMYLYLPDYDTDLRTFLGNLDAAHWGEWMADFAPEDFRVYLPRFTLEYESKLNGVLKTLGMGIAFSGSADFREMTPIDVCISEVRHKTFLQVNEEGTEAAAVTSVEMGLVSDPPHPVLDFNRPFFCAIVDNETGAILFMGAINDPS